MPLLGLLLAALVVLVHSSSSSVTEWSKYHNQSELENVLIEVNKKCPESTRLYSIGQSVQGRDLLVIEFSSRPGQHQLLQPTTKYVGNMHGNEPLGRELLLRLASFLCDQLKGGDQDIQALINTSAIHILPSMNPDGFEMALKMDPSQRGWLTGRANANGIDLNRDFPDLDTLFFYLEQNAIPRFDHLYALFNDPTKHQPETKAVGNWLLAMPFVLSANFHEGDLVANYPFDAGRLPDTNDYAKSPDDATFRWLASTYASAHAHMSKNDHAPCDGSAADAFARQGGITNGARWYAVQGGMQDFNYLATNAFEITLELACQKFPPGEQLPMFWEDNKKALIAYMALAHSGVKGIIVDATTADPIEGAIVWIRNGTETIPIRHPVTTWQSGDYWRLLPDGQYEVVASADGYLPASQQIKISNQAGKQAQILNFALIPKDTITAQ
jgi:hypothetical protein